MKRKSSLKENSNVSKKIDKSTIVAVFLAEKKTESSLNSKDKL